MWPRCDRRHQGRLKNLSFKVKGVHLSCGCNSIKSGQSIHWLLRCFAHDHLVDSVSAQWKSKTSYLAISIAPHARLIMRVPEKLRHATKNLFSLFVLLKGLTVFHGWSAELNQLSP